jgi:dipeptidyl aminopeptidase/acylaminoacyl peptidase
MKKAPGHCPISLLFITLILFGLNLKSQEAYAPPSLSEADYDRAAKFLSRSTYPLISGMNVRINWINKDHFWYRKTSEDGYEFLTVNAKKSKTNPAFDHKKLASTLSELRKEKIEPAKLPFYSISFSDDMKSVSFSVKGDFYTYQIKNDKCVMGVGKTATGRNSVSSPNGKYTAFIRDYNLWMKDLDTGKEKQLTKDGVKDFGYATDNAGWRKSKRPVLLWSPDSKKIATFRMDERGVGEMYMVSTKVGHPELEVWRYPLPEDSVIFRIHRVVIDVENSRVVWLKMKPDQHRSTTSDDIAGRDGRFLDVEWSPDASKLAFVSVSRDHKKVVLRVADPETGMVGDILNEETDTFFESGYNSTNWRILPETGELIWYSQRSNWGHLYLYSLGMGDLKNQITEGDWNVLKILHIDKENRIIYFMGAGREPGDPYFQYLYSVGLDGKNLRLLSPDSAYHLVNLSPDGRYFVDTYSTPAIPPVTVLRNNKGKKLADIEKADISKLLDAGWQAPVPFTVKARDGKTDLYGLMFKPTNMDPSKKYPIINGIYPGPQTGSIGSRSFKPSWRDKQALAELGFIVVSIDAMGTPMRSKSFHAAYYGNMGDNGLPDQISGMKQLAERYPWIDIDRAGIYGHSGGGYAAADAILRYPDFFKVAVSESGNHDNRIYEDDWGEKWQGLLKTNADGTTDYDNQANQLLAKNLKGHLLLAHGTLDGNVPVNNTLILVKELIAANKDFDLILFPNRAHGYGSDSYYMMRRKWDYFVRYLLGAEPPKEYSFKDR